jgi:hypothetical protein
MDYPRDETAVNESTDSQSASGEPMPRDRSHHLTAFIEAPNRTVKNYTADLIFFYGCMMVNVVELNLFDGKASLSQFVRKIV